MPRDRRLVHNGRWHVIDHGLHRKLGWGDLSLEDLDEVRSQLRGGLFLAIREAANFDPLGDERWGHYDRMGVHDPTLTPSDVAAQVQFAVSAEAGLLEHLPTEAAVTGTPTSRPRTTSVMRYISTADLAGVIAAHGLSVTGAQPCDNSKQRPTA